LSSEPSTAPTITYVLTLPALHRVYLERRAMLLREVDDAHAPGIVEDALQEVFAQVARVRFALESEEDTIALLRRALRGVLASPKPSVDGDYVFDWPDVLRRANIRGRA
jgi:hypothetical protein